MLSNYGDAEPISKEEAVEKVRESLITAYELRFGEYIPLTDAEKLAGDESWQGEASYFRGIIANLSVTSENDRYYTIPVIFDFWIDKYNGDIVIFYNGWNMEVYPFDPLSPDALVFAG